MAFLAMSLVVSAQLEPPSRKELIGVRSLALSRDGSTLCFVYRGDLWIVPSGGGRALPLTNNVEMEDNPVWSPDGNWIAFTSNRNGNNDVYVIPADGGQPQRLTFHSGSDVPADWTPDGKHLVISTTREDFFEHTYLLDVRTTRIRSLFRDYQNLSSQRVAADGKRMLYSRLGFPWNRPRYEGANAQQLWTFDLTSNEHREIRSNGFQHLWPQFSGDGRSMLVVTVTEKTPSTTSIGKSIGKNTDNVQRTPNVYRIGFEGHAQRLTDFVGGSGTRFLTVGGGKIAFEREGRVHLMEGNGKPAPISITGVVDEKLTADERLILTEGASDGALSPTGDRIAFTVRGEIWLVPTKKGRGPNADDAKQLTRYAGVDEQPLWHPDGKRLFFVSNREGANRIYALELEFNRVTPFTREDDDHDNLRLSPDKKWLWYWRAGKNGGLFRVKIEGGEPERIVNLNFGGDFALSPDGRYLVYARTLLNSGFNPWENARNLFVRDLSNGQEANVTQLATFHGNPEFSADGRFLYFTANRADQGIHVLPLQPEPARTTETELKYTKPKETPKFDFDFRDADRRIRMFNQGSAGNLRFDAENGDLLFLRNGDVWKINYAGEEARAITSGGGIGSFEVSSDGKSLFFTRNGLLNMLNLRDARLPVTGIAFRADWTRDVREERNAALNQLWQVYNARFYDGNFHGRDWAEIRERYRPFLESVGHRTEMATVLNMMIGELEASHTEAGSAPGGPPSVSSAHPGFIWDTTYDGPGLKILEVPFRSPGSFDQTKLEPGEIVLAINGQDVKADENLWKVLNGEVGREITLLVGKTATRSGAREVKYRALGGGEWGQIAYRNRIEMRRALVDRLSGGKVAYLHIAGMGGGNLQQFNREAWQLINGKDAVIIDVRENGGGNIADTLLDILERRPQARYLPRDGEEVFGPGTFWARPTVVMHSESSFSNAEMFPAMMKARGLATLVGMPTPGYVIYTTGFQLVDGTFARLPGTGVFRMDGSPMENEGQQPDVKVPWSARDYFAGKDPQLERAIQEALKKLR